MLDKNYLIVAGMLLKIKNNKRSSRDLIGLFFIGIVLVVLFYFGGNSFLLNKKVSDWPKAKAKVISLKRDQVCETPEVSSACYDIFLTTYFFIL